MKKLILVLSLLILASVPLDATPQQFCSGYQDGYATGYMEAKKTSIKPIQPICPIQPIKGFGDPQSDYKHGFIIGYKKGLFAP